MALMSVVTAFYLGSIGLMVSSFTGRKSIAVAVIIIGFLVAIRHLPAFSAKSSPILTVSPVCGVAQSCGHG